MKEGRIPKVPVFVQGMVWDVTAIHTAYPDFFNNKVKQAIAWLLKISFFDFVEIIIFLKPLKKRYRETGIVVWLVLVFFVSKYLIFTQPKLTEIPGPYIPMIGYVFYLSILFIIQFVLLISRKPERDADEENR